MEKEQSGPLRPPRGNAEEIQPVQCKRSQDLDNLRTARIGELVISMCVRFPGFNPGFSRL